MCGFLLKTLAPGPGAEQNKPTEEPRFCPLVRMDTSSMSRRIMVNSSTPKWPPQNNQLRAKQKILIHLFKCGCQPGLCLVIAHSSDTLAPHLSSSLTFLFPVFRECPNVDFLDFCSFCRNFYLMFFLYCNPTENEKCGMSEKNQEWTFYRIDFF